MPGSVEALDAGRRYQKLLLGLRSPELPPSRPHSQTPIRPHAISPSPVHPVVFDLLGRLAGGGAQDLHGAAVGTGDLFEIVTVDGEQVTLKGPWSSRAGCVNKRSFGPVVDVRLTTNPDALDKGHTFSTGTLTLSAAKQALGLTDDDARFERVEKFDSDEPYWVVRRNGGEA